MGRVSTALGGAALLALAVAPPPERARGQRPAPTQGSVALENTEALAHFRQALEELASGNRHRVRVVHWGDSNVAAGIWTRPVREALWQRYGNGGPGYLVPRFGTHDHDDLTRSSASWEARRRGYDGRFGPLDGLWGLGGVAMEGRGRAAWVETKVQGHGAQTVLEVHALARPRGGALAVEVDGQEAGQMETEAARPGLARGRWTMSSGEHRVRVKIRGWRRVRLLGLVVERSTRGVVYDVLGINGHRASAILDWDRRLLGEQLENRRPDLVVLSYGGNEALDPNVSPERFGNQLERTLARVRQLAPDASVLVVGPVAMCPSAPPLTYLDPQLPAMIATQRRVTVSAGAAFWDSSRVMGGAYALCGWRHRTPSLVSGDNLHLSREGYEVVGRKFASALLRATGSGQAH